MPGPTAHPEIDGVSDVRVLTPANGHHRWAVRRGGRALVLHAWPRRRWTGRARRAAEERLAALVALAPAPGLEPVVDGGIDDGELWWLTDTDAADTAPLRRGPMDLADVLRIGVDLASGLGRVHAAGLVSGEVTPDAVVRTGTGARLAVAPVPPEPPLAPTGPAPLHVPPEVLEGRAWSPAADLYGLASTLFTLLEGRAPHQREAAQGVPELLLTLTLGTRVRFDRPDVGEPLRRVIERGLDADPERRPSAAGFGAALVAATGAPLADRLDTVGPSAPLPSSAPPPGLGSPPGTEGDGLGRPLGSAYVLLEPIGRGAMGRVWRGVRRRDGSAVAVKVLRPELADDPDQVGRFLTERNALRAVVDDHVVRVHDLVVEGAVLAIVMDLVVGGDLREVLRREGPLAPPRAASLLAGVARGLAAVHRAGIVHRDVKPENVLVPAVPGDGPPVRLTDFGIARIVDGAQLTRPTQLVGTPDYLAPELAAGRSPSAASDVYALGVLGYELVAGRRPFVGSNPAAVLRAHLEVAPTEPPGIPYDLWGLLARCLAKGAEHRPTADQVADALEALAPALAGLAPLERLAEPEEPLADPGPEGRDALGAGRAPAVPVPVPLVLAGVAPEPGGGDRLDTRTGRALAEPAEAPAAERTRWPVFSALALACVVLLVAGWFTAKRDRGATDDRSAAATTTSTTGAAPPAPSANALLLPLTVEGRVGGGYVVRFPGTAGKPRWKDVDELSIRVWAPGSGPEAEDPEVIAKGQVDARGGGSDGAFLATDALPDGDPDGIVDHVTVDVPEGACLAVALPYSGEPPTEDEIGFPIDEIPTTCTELIE